MTAAVRTTCAYCGVGCGILATHGAGRDATIAGDPAHPANHGKLCAKGRFLGETLGLEGRLLHPQIDGKRAGWDMALDRVANRFSQTIAEHGPDSVAFYVSGQLLTEDYHVANKLMKGFIGSGNIDTNSRLCMSSAVAAHGRAFGEDIVPCTYEDLDAADLIVLLGSNTAWCHPVIWQRIEAARDARGMKIVVIDPRRTETADNADLHIAVAPDGDVALFNALLARLWDIGMVDAAWLSAHAEVPGGFRAALSQDPGIPASQFEALVALVAQNPRMITLFSQGANQSVGGTDKGNAIINLHLALGRIGKPGAGPFSITGQPNAMGGREVGGLATMLAAHRGFSVEDCAAVSAFWGAPNIARKPGYKAVALFEAVHEGRVKALWVMGTNPAVSMPDAGFVRDALARCEFLVVSEVMAQTDTSPYAKVLLPALGWGEKAGMVTNSDRMMSRQRAFLPAPGEARADWDIVAEVGRRMGFAKAFAYASPADVFREFAGLTAHDNGGRRLLDLGAWAKLSDADYEAFSPARWGGEAPFASGRFPTPDGRARLVPVGPPPGLCSSLPLTLNTGRIRDQWHTMTRTGLSPTLSQHRREPLVEMHPCNAAERGIREGDIAEVRTASGRALFRAHITDAQRPGDICVPMHWSDQFGPVGRAGRLPCRAVDPISGQPGFKSTPADVVAVPVDWRAFLVSSSLPPAPKMLWWVRSRVPGGWLLEMAGVGVAMLDTLLPEGDRLDASDASFGMQRTVVRASDGRLLASLYISRDGALPGRGWIADQLAAGPATDPLALLAARPRTGLQDPGDILCLCHGIGSRLVESAIRDRGLRTVSCVGATTRAGTGCGSCRPAIAALCRRFEADQVAA